VIAVADASPLCYLVLIGEIDLLPQLFSRVLCALPTKIAVENASDTIATALAELRDDENPADQTD